MFHGTRATPPEVIYNSEEGFNINFSKEGLWGKAIYFAKNSSYSNAYTSTLNNGFKQMIMASVLIGKNITMVNKDHSLREPPVQPGTKIKYDSVKGHTGGSDVFMIYSNKKAYPRYLITYKE